jgi:transposase
VIAGIDTHKRTLAVAIVDDAARQQTFEEFDNTPRGHERLAAWLHSRQVRVVGVEGSGHLGRAASACLMDAGHDVREVPCMLTVRERQTRPSGGKSDPIDALAIARITLRDEQTLQPARCRDDITEELRILSDYRRQLVAERIRLTNRAHADLCVLHPGYKSEVPALTRPSLVRAALDLASQHRGVRAELLTRRLQRVADIDDEVRQIAKRLEQLVKDSGSSLLDLPGVGIVVAARIFGETGDVRRYRDCNAYASANGTAPISFVAIRASWAHRS